MLKSILAKLTFLLLSIILFNPNAYALTAEQIVVKSYEAWRGNKSSIATMTMIITRPDRVETMSLKSWTKGDDLSLSKFIAPVKFKDQAVLVNNDSMWTYSPKSKRSIKISNSLKSKAWMGSDLSYDDISKSTASIAYYDYTILSTTIIDGKKVYIIQSIPKQDAPVVWGKEITAIREDFALVWKDFYDQSGEKIKRFEAVKIEIQDGLALIKHMKAYNLEKEGYTTEFITNDIVLNPAISDNFFTLNTLEKP
jgi:outer membrane lipoprotein-sorting protein